MLDNKTTTQYYCNWNYSNSWNNGQVQ